MEDTTWGSASHRAPTQGGERPTHRRRKHWDAPGLLETQRKEQLVMCRGAWTPGSPLGWILNGRESDIGEEHFLQKEQHVRK